MALKLYYHPFSSFCQKVLMALYENDVPFEPELVDLADEAARRAFYALWPLGRFPVLEDTQADRLVPESSAIIEYLALHHPGPVQLIPTDSERAFDARLRDRLFDLYIQQPMQKIVGDSLRPPEARDWAGVDAAKTLLRTSLDLAEQWMEGRIWAIGEPFTIADCAAAPALFYADWIMPLCTDHPNLRAYLDRLCDRSSFRRAVDEARPYRHAFPLGPPPRQSCASEI